MLRFFRTLLLFSTTFSLGLAGYYRSDRESAEAEGVRLTKALHEAQQTRDEEQLRRIVSDTIRIRMFSQEESLTRDQFFGRLHDFGGEITRIDAKWTTANAVNDVVAVSFWMKMSAIFPDRNTPLIHAALYRYEFCKEVVAWKLCGVSVQN